MHTFDAALQDLSPAAFEKRLARGVAQLEHLAEIPQGELDERGRLLYSLAHDDVSSEVKALQLGCHLYAVNSIGIGGETFVPLPIPLRPI